ncbi:MAG TPA: ParB N-terminal domain-containing protein [Acidimicrobiales bacterium]|nr:ParB N-terminal domain-containing protein [Acidimicrobiales bacterium]
MLYGTASSRLLFIVDGRAAISGDSMVRPPGQDWPEGRVVRLADLAGSYSPRVTKVDEDHVLGLAEVLDRLPPVVVDERTMKVIDGVHRVEASRRMGRTEIRALLFSGSETDAFVVAVQANVRHGKPLSRSERQSAAGTLLRRSPDRSDRWVAEVCGLSHSTVSRIRQAAEALGPVVPGVRTGRDGRRRPVDPAAGRAAIARALAEGPASSFRQVAETAGVAPSTAHRAAAAVRRLRREPLERPAPSASPLSPVLLLDIGALHPADVPLGHIYEVADELRRRARTCLELAEALERRARACRPARSGHEPSALVDHALEPVAEASEAGRRR